jgi:hypothetical protein
MLASLYILPKQSRVTVAFANSKGVELLEFDEMLQA